jgi:hypothetical protein
MNWFLASGDAPFFFPEQLKQLTLAPHLWHGDLGFGMSWLPLLWVDYPFRLITFVLSSLGLSWFVIDKLWWITVFVLATSGAYRLARHFLPEKKSAIIASIIYASNTYILLLFDGGQFGVALSSAVWL